MRYCSSSEGNSGSDEKGEFRAVKPHPFSLEFLCQPGFAEQVDIGQQPHPFPVQGQGFLLHGMALGLFFRPGLCGEKIQGFLVRIDKNIALAAVQEQPGIRGQIHEPCIIGDDQRQSQGPGQNSNMGGDSPAGQDNALDTVSHQLEHI